MLPPLIADLVCPFGQLTVFGLGLIGGSLVMAAREAYPELIIRAVDPNVEALQEALRLKVVNQVNPQGFEIYPGMPEAPHLIVLASHLPVNLALLEQLAQQVAGKPVVMIDLGSCKRAIVEQGAALLPEQFIGAHPMAGRELAGLTNATSLLFAGKRFLFTPHAAMAQTHPNLLAVMQFVEGFKACPSLMNAETHDWTMAYVSHFPQLYAVLLTNVIAKHGPGKILSFHGGGIDDQLRLAASPYPMWGPIYDHNADNMRVVLDEVIDMLNQLKAQLDQPELADWFATSNQMHQAFHQLKQPASNL